MKNTIMIVCAAMTFAAMAATKVATQDWVRRYVGESFVSVSTNAALRSVTYSVKVDDDPALAEELPKGAIFSMTAVENTNILFRAESSNVSGVSTGTTWRVMGRYANSVNPVLPQLRIRAWVDKGAVTNVTWKLCASNVVSGAEYVSVRDGGKWHLINIKAPSERVSLVALRVSDEEAQRAYMANIARSRIREIFASFGSLLISSARAEWVDEIPMEQWLNYEIPDFEEDLKTLDTRTLDALTLTVKQVDGVPVEYNAEVFKVGFNKDITDFSQQISEKEFLDSKNWNLPFVEDPRGRGSEFDKLVFFDNDGNEVTLTRRNFEKSEEWKRFAKDMYLNYALRFGILKLTHDCTANPNNSCLCYAFLSIHCPNGRGQNYPVQAYWDDMAVEVYAKSLHKWILAGGCSTCENGCGVGNHNRPDGHCRCDCGNNVQHVPVDDLHCRCQCNETIIAHVPHVSLCGCQCRGDDGGNNPEFHKNAYSACGCICGTFNKNVTKDKKWHPHPLKDGEETEGEEMCECYCKQKDQHIFEESELCPKVCGCCHKWTRLMVEATIDDHREKDSSRAANYENGEITCCGCECGEMLASDQIVEDSERFHYQKVGSCRCLGAHGQGGEWHFPCPDDDCPGVCRHLHGDDRMRVANPLQGHRAEKLFELAEPKNHIASTEHCGCKCGDLDGSEEGAGHLHHANVHTCGCMCGSKDHDQDSKWHKNDPDKCGCKCNNLLKIPDAFEWHHVMSEGCIHCDCGWISNHNNRTNDCGCVCGTFTRESMDNRWHPRPPKDINNPGGEKRCACRCGRNHVFEEGMLCPEVCSGCRMRNKDGLRAGIDDHREKDPSRSAVETCGCECGEMRATNETVNAVARFHYRKTGSCMCLGADGQGGEWHFPNPKTGCSKVCATAHADGEMRIASPLRGEKCEHGLHLAEKTDHVVAELVCGCKCGRYSRANDNIPDDMHHANANTCGCECGGETPKTHRFPLNSCTCYCGTSVAGAMHRSLYMKECAKICGKCSLAFDHGGDEPATLGRVAEISDHSIDPVSCGCKCGVYSGGKGNLTGRADRFHHCIGSSCWCICNTRHLDARKTTPDDCDFCSNCQMAMDDSRTYKHATTVGHRDRLGSCECVCGYWSHGEVGGHEKRQDECACFCRVKKYPHAWVMYEPKTQIGSFECEDCNRTVYQYESQYICEHCEEFADKSEWEEGHGPHQEGDTPNGVPEPCGCGCTVCDCAACARGRGTCTGCGGVCGGGSDQGGSGGGDGTTVGGDDPLNI